MSQRAPLTLRSSAFRPGRSERVAFMVLALLACLLAHQATYLLAFRGAAYQSTMTRTGHDGYWMALVLAVAVASLGLALVAVRQIRRLQREAGSTPTVSVGDGFRAYLALAARSWGRLALASTVIFTLQENAEALLAGLPIQGLGVVLGHGYLPLLTILIAAFAVAIVAALVHWRRLSLLGRLAATVPDWVRSVVRRRPSRASLARPTRVAGAPAGRAPPMGFVRLSAAH